jgi:hypothetical protein
MVSEGQHYATSYALSASDLFIGFPYQKYISFAKEWTHQELETLCTQVFKYFFYLVIQDIIENSTTFKFPPGTRAWLEMIPVSGEKFAQAR